MRLKEKEYLFIYDYRIEFLEGEILLGIFKRPQLVSMLKYN